MTHYHGLSALLLACALAGCSSEESGGEANVGTDGSTGTTAQPSTTENEPTPSTTSTTDDPASERSSSTGDLDDSSDSSGADLSCGDGIVDPGEACDDGKATEACTEDCTWQLGYELWSVREPNFAPGGIGVRDGAVWVVGSQIDADPQVDRAYPRAHVYDVDGVRDAVIDFHDEGVPGQGNGVAFDDKGGVYIAGQTGWFGTPIQAQLWHRPAAGDGWVQTVGPVSADSSDFSLATSVAFHDNRVTVGARSISPVQGLVEQLDATGTIEWQTNGEGSTVSDVFAMDDGSVLIARSSSLRRYDPDGVEVWTLDLPYCTAVTHHDDRLFVAGESRVCQVTLDGVSMWCKETGAEQVSGLTVTDAETLVVTGRVLDDLIVVGHIITGADVELWRATEPSLSDSGIPVDVVAGPDSTVAVTGVRFTNDVDVSEGWVARFGS